MIEERVLADRAHDAGEEAQPHRHRERADHEDQRRGDPVHDDLAYETAITIRAAPVPAEHPADPLHVLLGQRAIEAQLPGEPVEILGAHGGRHRIDRRGAPGRQMQHGEAGHRHEDKYDEGLQDPANQVPVHGSLGLGALLREARGERGDKSGGAGANPQRPARSTIVRYAFHPHSFMFQLLTSVLLFGL